MSDVYGWSVSAKQKLRRLVLSLPVSEAAVVIIDHLVV